MSGVMSRWRAFRVRSTAMRWAVRQGGDVADAEFEAWRNAAPDHAASFDRFSATFNDPALTEALRGMPRTAIRRGFGLRPIMAGTAFACAALAAAVWGLPDYLHPTRRLQTAIGQRLAAALPDGTRIELNGDSVLVVSFRSGRRDVTLERGECFFDVAHDERRPFHVMAGAANLTVRGTAFDVDRRIGGVELAVYRGKVDMAPATGDGAHAQATVGQRLGFHDGEVRREAEFDPDAGDWRDGWLDTGGMTLAELAEQLNRRGPVTIDIADAELARIMVAGRFRIADPDHLVARLAALYRFQVQYAAGRVVLSR